MKYKMKQHLHSFSMTRNLSLCTIWDSSGFICRGTLPPKFDVNIHANMFCWKHNVTAKEICKIFKALTYLISFLSHIYTLLTFSDLG